MANTTPNKETIRRLCLLHKIAECYLYTDVNSIFVDLYVNLVDTEALISLTQELESWCGMKFKLANPNSQQSIIEIIKTKGEKIYPL